MVANLMIVFAILAVAGLVLVVQVDNDQLPSLGFRLLLGAIMGEGIVSMFSDMETLISSSPTTYAAICTLILASVLLVVGIVIRLGDTQTSWRFIWRQHRSTFIRIVVVGTLFLTYSGVLLFTRVV